MLLKLFDLVLVEALVKVVEQAMVEADLLKDVVLKLCLKDLLPQALRLEVLSQAMIAKLKLLKVKAGKVLLLQALLQKDLTSAKFKLVKVEAVQCQG